MHRKRGGGGSEKGDRCRGRGGVSKERMSERGMGETDRGFELQTELEIGRAARD